MSDTADIAADLLRGTQEIADFVGENRRTVQYMLEQGNLPGFRMGSLWRMRRSTYIRWLEDQEKPFFLPAKKAQ